MAMKGSSVPRLKLTHPGEVKTVKSLRRTAYRSNKEHFGYEGGGIKPGNINQGPERELTGTKIHSPPQIFVKDRAEV